MPRFALVVATTLVACLGTATTQATQDQPPLPLLTPTPQSIQILENETTDLRDAEILVGGRAAADALAKLDVAGPEGLPSGGYVLATGTVDERSTIALAGSDDAGTFYGRQTLQQLMRLNKVQNIVIRDYPAIAMRGGMESFYGNPWPHADLLRHLDWMGAHRLNAFQYTVSGDARTTGALWRSPYPAAELARFREAIARADANHIDFIYRINPEANMSPAHGICHALRSDLDALVARYQQLYDTGERTFSIGWDDVGGDFVCHLDRTTFGGRPQPLSAAQAHVVNYVYDNFIRSHPGTKLVTVPTDYWGTGANARRLAFAQAIPADVPIFWTGPQVVSPTITAADLAAAERSFGHRRLLIFDNYPVNDYAPFHQHLGPLAGRDPALAESALGLLANEMQEPEASLISLYTVAEFAWNPSAYNAQESWTRSLQEFGGPAAGALRDYAEVSRYSPLSPDAAPRLEPLIHAFRNAYRAGGDLTTTGDALLAELGRIAAATATLKSTLANQSFLTDSAPWFTAFDGRVVSSQHAVQAIRAQARGDTATYRTERRAMGNALSAASKPGKVVAPGIFDELFDLASSPRPGTVIKYDDGRLATFARGTNGQLQWSRQYSEGSNWTAFQAIPGITMTGQPDVILGRNGLPVVFVRGTDGQLWHNWQTSTSGAWHGWVSLGGPISDSPRAVLTDDGLYAAFARNANGVLTHKWQVRPGGEWVPFHPIGGITMRGKPEVFVGRNGAIAAFVRGSDNSVWHNWQTGPGSGFHGWIRLGGSTADVPVGAMVANGALSVFIRRTDGVVATAWQSSEGSTWGPFHPIGGITVWGEPSVAVNNGDAMSVYVRGSNNVAYTSWQARPGDAFGGWHSLNVPGTISSTPRIGENRRGAFSLYALSGNSMVTAWQWAPGSGWSGWANLGGSLTP